MSINNTQSQPKWLRDLNQGLDQFNRSLNQVSQAVNTFSQPAARDQFIRSATGVQSTAPVSTPGSIRFNMDNQGNLHTTALGLVDVSLNPDSFFNGEYTKQVKLETSADGTKKLKADFKVLGLFNYPIESQVKSNSQTLQGFQIDFIGQKTMDVHADLQFLGMKLPIRTFVQARRVGNGQYRMYVSSAVCKNTRIPNFVANFCLWLAAKTNDIAGLHLSGPNTLDMNVPQFLAGQGMYGN